MILLHESYSLNAPPPDNFDLRTRYLVEIAILCRLGIKNFDFSKNKEEKEEDENLEHLKFRVMRYVIYH